MARLTVGVTLAAVVVLSGIGLWASGSDTPARTAATVPIVDTPSPQPRPDLDPAVDGACTEALRTLVLWGVRVILPDEPLPDACAGVNRGTVSWKLDALAGDACAEVIRPRRGPGLDDPDKVCMGVSGFELNTIGERVGRPFPPGAG
jgi:hypothetical protein